jgi:hypothetical protein
MSGIRPESFEKAVISPGKEKGDSTFHIKSKDAFDSRGEGDAGFRMGA